MGISITQAGKLVQDELLVPLNLVKTSRHMYFDLSRLLELLPSTKRSASSAHLRMKNILSIDVEDWFHILELDSTPNIASWSHLESRVEKNFYTLIDEIDKHNAKATFFFLGWIAEKLPSLVKVASDRGHEVASHGYSHQLIYTQSREEFKEDITKSKQILEDITGQAVFGYRSPGFSIVSETLWVLEGIREGLPL